MKNRRNAWAAALVAAVLAVTGCASQGAPEGGTPIASPSPTTPVATASPEPSAPSPTADAIDCESMLTPEADARLRAQGFSPSPKPWTQFNFTPTAPAIECPWAPPGVMEAARYYGWAALNPGEKDSFLALVEENGYSTEETAEGTWLLPLDDGSPRNLGGYLITDDWIAIAPTREEVQDIVWAR